jgi:peptidoglycan/xylan/chitin deacetylase (PgdA/CDA1 family)
VQPERRRAVAPEAQVRRVAARVSPGAIVDLHDADGVPGAGARVAEALPDLIDALRQRGFALAPLRDLL